MAAVWEESGSVYDFTSTMTGKRNDDVNALTVQHDSSAVCVGQTVYERFYEFVYKRRVSLNVGTITWKPFFF